MSVAEASCLKAPSLFTVILGLLQLPHVASVPQDRHSIVRRDQATLALNAQGSLVQLSGEPSTDTSEHGLLKEISAGHSVSGRTDIDATAAVVRKSLESACRALNKLEARIDSLGLGSAAPEFAVYEVALATWRAGHPGDQPACRVQQLTTALCEDASELADMLWSVEGGSSWDSNIRKLMERELNNTECHSFVSLPASLSWNPAASKPRVGVSSAEQLDELIHDHEYEAVYAQAGHRAAAFGPVEVQWELRPQGRFRMERVEHLHQYRTLRKSVPGLDVTTLQQIVTFGGGSGDEIAMVYDLGYRGTHLVYDHPALLLMQRLWLRYSGVPAVLGENLAASANSVNHKIVLESSLGQKIFSHIDASKAKDSLFRSTAFFTQDDAPSFEKLRPMIKDFGFIHFAFQSKHADVDVSEYLRTFIEQDLARTHNVVTWRAKEQTSEEGDVFHLVAVGKSHGPVACQQELNCMDSTLHHSLSRHGDVHFVKMGVPVKESGSSRARIFVALFLAAMSLVISLPGA